MKGLGKDLMENRDILLKARGLDIAQIVGDEFIPSLLAKKSYDRRALKNPHLSSSFQSLSLEIARSVPSGSRGPYPSEGGGQNGGDIFLLIIPNN
jgi:hypothetical protein